MIFTIVLDGQLIISWTVSALPRKIFMLENLQAGSHEVFDVTMNNKRLPATKLRKWLIGKQ